MKVGVVLAAGAAAFAVWVAPSAGTPGACKPGQRTVGGTTIVVHCGPAKATVKVGGKTYQIFGGTCGWKPSAALYMVDVGIQSLNSKQPRARYLGVRSSHRRGGTYTNVAVAFQVNRTGYTLGRSTVTISRDLERGSFSGDLLFGVGSAKGSWTC